MFVLETLEVPFQDCSYSPAVLSVVEAFLDHIGEQEALDILRLPRLHVRDRRSLECGG